MSKPSAGPENRLAREKSAYLRQHAHNPVDWYPWGAEALARARAEDRPILLSVGYSACHWCHVMAHESFEDPATAKLMNELFINIKVDREERPDVDQLYQGVVALMGRGGGWPLTVFLTPELKPFFGGTYFPPEDRYGLMGFPRLLQAVHDAYRNRRADVDAQAAEFIGGLERLSTHALLAAPNDLGPDQVVAAARLLAQELDRTHGGFGSRPKFPNPMNVQLLLRADRRVPDPELRSGAMLTLEKMALGGIYDQLGGGFHRYSVDERWLVPHFEKMLYDNGQLVHLYAEAYLVEPRPLFRRVVAETIEYVQREMTSPEGAFYASQDADSEGEEGKFFVWRPEEVDEVLSAELAEVARLRWNIRPGGNFEEHGTTVLEARRSIPELAKELGREESDVEVQLEQARRALFAARERRVKPGRDEKLLVSWNGLMIRGLAFAARVFDRPEWAALARRSADFLIEKLWDGSRLLRLYQDGPSAIEGFAEDYGHLASGLVALYQATFEARYLTVAEELVRRANELFWDGEREAFLAAPRGQGDLVTPQYALHDSASPSGASTLTEAQVALAALTGKPDLMWTGTKFLKKVAEPMGRNPFAFGHLWLAADAWVDGAAEVTIVGERSAAQPLIRTATSLYAPTVAIAFHDPAGPAPQVLSTTLQDRRPVNGKPAAYLCRKFSCAPPVTEPAALQSALAEVR